MLKAHYIVQDWYRDGIPIWWDESERVSFDAVSRISKSRAAIERAQEAASGKGKKPVPGRYFIAEPKVMDGGDFPTRQEWIEEQEKKRSIKPASSKFSESSKNILQGRK